MPLQEIQERTIRQLVDKFLGGDAEAARNLELLKNTDTADARDMTALANDILKEQGLDSTSPIAGVKLLPVQVKEARARTKAIRENDPAARTWWAIIEAQAGKGDPTSLEFLKARSQLMSQEENKALSESLKGVAAPPVHANIPRSLDQIAAEMGISAQGTPVAPNPFTASAPPHVPVPLSAQTTTSSAPMSGVLSSQYQHVHVPDVPPAVQVKHNTEDHLRAAEEEARNAAARFQEAFRQEQERARQNVSQVHVAEVVEVPMNEGVDTQLQRLEMYMRNLRDTQRALSDQVAEAHEIYQATIKARNETQQMHSEIMQVRALLLTAMRADNGESAASPNGSVVEHSG